MNIQHTPGPWFAELDHVVARTEKGGYLTRQSSVAICYAEENPAENHKNPEALANARLIAAAPDMYQALLAAQQCIQDMVEAYQRDCARLVLDEAVKSLKNDAGKLVSAALDKAAQAI